MNCSDATFGRPRSGKRICSNRKRSSRRGRKYRALPVESVVEASVAAVADAAGAALDNAVAPDAEPVKEAPEKGCDTNNSSSLVLDETKNSTVVIALVVSYKGEQFSGFARQPGQLTVQGELEEAFQWFFAELLKLLVRGALIQVFMLVGRW